MLPRRALERRRSGGTKPPPAVPRPALPDRQPHLAATARPARPASPEPAHPPRAACLLLSRRLPLRPVIPGPGPPGPEQDRLPPLPLGAPARSRLSGRPGPAPPRLGSARLASRGPGARAAAPDWSAAGPVSRPCRPLHWPAGSACAAALRRGLAGGKPARGGGGGGVGSSPAALDPPAGGRLLLLLLLFFCSSAAAGYVGPGGPGSGG